MAKQAAARRINGVVGSNGSITPSTPRAIESQPVLINRILMVWCFIRFALLQEIITERQRRPNLSLPFRRFAVTADDLGFAR